METEPSARQRAESSDADRRQAEDWAPQYDFEIDTRQDTTHTAVIGLVGAGKRVLELGPATGYMSEVFSANGCTVVGIELDPEMAHVAAEHCQRVIVGDLDTMDLDAELGSETFDVIVAADVLEHLRDPLAVLRRLRPFLAKGGGSFVVSLPNVAHGSVRLALLEGSFHYQERGLLDRTHLRFFTWDTIEQLFGDAGLAIVHVDRRQLDIAASEVHFNARAVPPEVIRAIEADPDARTYQFVIRAEPAEGAATKRLEHVLREQALALDAARHELDEALAERDRLASAAEEMKRLETAVAAIAEREGQLRTSLIEAHDQVLRRDEQIQEQNLKLEQLGPAAIERDRLARENAELWRAQNEAKMIIDVRGEEIRQLQVRLGRLLESLPFRAWRSLGRLPILRRTVARRTAAYQAEVRETERRGS